MEQGDASIVLFHSHICERARRAETRHQWFKENHLLDVLIPHEEWRDQLRNTA